ncbi:SRPBCC domain-containing protein [Vallitalea okinawensis]|uniref:SRPBCC domain-containing protein n=1 Tax=Vallitalea okinawensis TaxID=2078660 RepID=UPI000CFBB2DB|nr:SRPBCC domain-containing protein [Vallitalea okinawensis]
MKLVYHFYIASSLENIWSILTTPEGSSKIFYGAEVHSTFKKGDSIQYIGPGRDGDNTLHIQGIIEDVKVNEKLKHTFIVGDAYRDNGNRFSSTITYELKPSEHFVKLIVIHDDWDEGDPAYENTKENWWLMLSNIKTLAETGKPLNIGLHE